MNYKVTVGMIIKVNIGKVDVFMILRKVQER